KNSTIQVVTAVKKIELVRIPDITGQSKEDAKYRLEQEGFVVDYAETYHDTVKAGKVIKTSPDVGTEQAKGSTVYLSVSKGAETKYTTVPSIVNTTRENAEVALKNAKLSVGGIKEEYSDSVAKGNVISQSIAANTSVEEGVTVDFVVSKGPEKATVPNLWGNPKDRAIEKLHAQGLNVEVYEEYSDEVEGRVFKTSPAADEKVAHGSTVKIYLSKGPKPAEKPSTEENTNTENTDDATNSGNTDNTDNSGDNASE
ncbi:MAG: PASTA domain-containing protein, partial [Lachnospiraceae bacterium]|nr:PASTA domain-containing protein [Lachnospiraceae bacterium]